MQFVTDIHGPQIMIPNDSGDPFPFTTTMRLTFVDFSETSQRLVDGLP